MLDSSVVILAATAEAVPIVAEAEIDL